jgi:hypothetical protein
MPDMKLVPLKLPPGYANNGTVYQTKGRWHSGNLVRFFQGNIQPVGGWLPRTLSGASIVGTPSAAIAWTPDTGTVAQTPILAIATTSNLYVVVSGVVHDITPAGFPSNNAARTWTLDVFGSYLVAQPIVEGDFSINIHLYVWTGDVTAAAVAASGAPPAGRAVVTTPERFLVQIGGYDPNGVYDPVTPTNTPPLSRTVYWASQETTDTWIPAVTNSAGSFPLATEGAGMAGARIRGGTLIWTNVDLHLMTYIGGILLYSFNKVGDECGIISSRAAVTLDSVAMWMGQNGFFQYNGYTTPLPCEVQDYVFGNINMSLARKIWALSNPAYHEVTWFYPSATATEIDSYVTYNYIENHWVFGSLSRTCGVPIELPGTVPVLVDANGVVYDHETGTSRSGSPTPFVESGPAEIGDGDTLMNIERLVPDEDNLGDVLLTVYAQNRPMGAQTTHGPFIMKNEPANVRVKARQVRLRFSQYDPSLLLGPTVLFHYSLGDAMTQATYTRNSVANFSSDGAGTVTAPPVHSGNWRIGTMRVGAIQTSKR